MKKKLSVFSAVILMCTLCFSLVSCNENEDLQATSALPKESAEDKGEKYIDSFIFFGESTTYHLKSRGVLSGGTDTFQVWSTPSGTSKLDMTILSLQIVYPETGELLTVGEAVQKKSPERIFLCFGLNGAVGNIKRGKEYFKTCYKLLIDEILSKSPSTSIYLASAYPIAKSMDMSKYTVDAKTLNEYISITNSWTSELALEYGAPYLDTASTLTDKDGFLCEKYHIGDGHHLTAEAYEKVIFYIRTH